jgi:hypothetical protein
MARYHFIQYDHGSVRTSDYEQIDLSVIRRRPGSRPRQVWPCHQIDRSSSAAIRRGTRVNGIPSGTAAFQC